MGQNSAPISSHPSSPGIGSQSFPEPWKAYLLLKTTVDEGRTHSLAYMEKSKTAGFTPLPVSMLYKYLVLGWSYCDVWLHQPLMSTNITFQGLSGGLGTSFGSWELSYGTLFWPTSSPSLTIFNKTKFRSIIYNLQSTALAFFNLQIHPLTDSL